MVSPDAMLEAYPDSPRLDPEKLADRLSSLNPLQRRLLNEYAHDSAGSTFSAAIDTHPLVAAARQQLVDRGLLVEEESGPPSVTRGALLHPEGPGLRRDTPWGTFKRLPATVRRAWLEALDLDPETVDLTLFVEALSSASPSREERELLEDTFGTDRWRSAGAFSSLPETLSDLYPWAKSSSDPLGRSVLRGRLLPGWKGEELTGLLVSNRHRPAPDEAESLIDGSNPPGEDAWERKPFGYTRQLKILLVLADGIPFRSTEEGYPYLFDLKEAARLTDWSLEHVHALVRRCMEQNLLASNGERFCLTEAAVEARRDSRSDTLLLSGVPLEPPREEAPQPPPQTDCSAGRMFWEALRMGRRSKEPFRLDAGVEALAKHPVSWRYLAAGRSPLVDPRRQRREAAVETFRTLHWLGFLDGVFKEEQLHSLRLNERGKQLLETDESPEQESGQLPFILQPDGTLMVPLDAGLEDFRHINPFVLIVNVDNMIEYRIDRQSLVQSLNDGWDAGAFYRFLLERAERIPDPVQELFDEVAQPAEKVQLERVHHLLRFESGATASKALRALSNYKPERISEKEILLRSKTTEETIRRNLSRGGVRLQKADGPARTSSPLLDEPDEDSPD